MEKRDIDCEQALRKVFEYVDHELGEADHEAMHRHLETCKSCYSRMDFERRLKEKLNTLREQNASQRMSARINALLKDL